jgi:hypothetical protein
LVVTLKDCRHLWLEVNGALLGKASGIDLLEVAAPSLEAAVARPARETSGKTRLRRRHYEC